MYINITDNESANNKASSFQLVHYLDKEERLLDRMTHETWFNGKGGDHPSYFVRSSIDNNIAKLSKSDSKFFLLNISPSQKEIAFLKGIFGEEGAKTKFKEYAVSIMDSYARNFNRQGINNNENLLWFGKLENFRYYTYKDKEVQMGQKKRGEMKPGEQMHIQIIVSRKDITNKVKLSPMNTSKGKNKEHSKKMGEFDRTAFKNLGEKLFDQLFLYQRNIDETFQYANTQKRGSTQQKQELITFKDSILGSKNQIEHSSMNVLEENKSILVENEQAGFLDIVFSKADYDPSINVPRKKKRKRGAQQQTGYSL